MGITDVQISLKLVLYVGRAGLECDQCNIGIIGDECKKCAVDEHWNGNYPDHSGYAGSIVHLKYTRLRCQYFTGQKTLLIRGAFRISQRWSANTKEG